MKTFLTKPMRLAALLMPLLLCSSCVLDDEEEDTRRFLTGRWYVVYVNYDLWQYRAPYRVNDEFHLGSNGTCKVYDSYTTLDEGTWDVQKSTDGTRRLNFYFAFAGQDYKPSISAIIGTIETGEIVLTGRDSGSSFTIILKRDR